MDRKDQQKPYDFLVVGSGFAGSITAMALSKSGYRVCLIERGEHPRFAIGESSTPIADMVLRDLADKYDLPFLKKLSRYGEWQKHYPEIVCGLKRGFSYYHHQKGKKFESDEFHSNELLVAASENDINSDTNWLRSDVDHFLVEKAKDLGVEYLDRCEILSLVRVREEEIWNFELRIGGKPSKSKASWIIDATGSSAFSEKFLGATSTSDGFVTNSAAIYTHFEETDHWSYYLKNRNFHTEEYPYNPDHSALHQIIDEGWVWMLRFNNNLLSSGLVIDGSSNELDKYSADEIWKQVLHSYPSINKIFEKSRIAEIPGRFFRSGRLQRKLNKNHGDGWVALNHTAGFVDPLHSTGIAHSLIGIENILKIFSSEMCNSQLSTELKELETNYFKELSFIDLMISSCYLSRHHAGLFNAAVMLYFIASIKYEKGRLTGNTSDTFLCAEDEELWNICKQVHTDIKNLMQGECSEGDVQKLIQKIKVRIKPYNSVGLMDPSCNNMYSHTAVTL